MSLNVFHAGHFMEHVVRTENKLRNRYIWYLKNDTAIGKMIGYGYYWEEFMVDLYKHYYVEGTDVIDIGGNIGMNTLLMEEFVSEYNQIHVFEPVYHEIIRKTLEENNVSEQRVRVYPVGLSDTQHEVSFHIHPWDSQNNFGAVSMCKTEELRQDRADMHRGTLLVNIDVFPLTFFEFPRRVSVVKIDVEGLECSVLKGMMSFIRVHQPTIFIEIWKHKLGEFLNSKEGHELFLHLKYKIGRIQLSKYIGIDENDEEDYILYHGDIPTKFHVQMFNVNVVQITNDS